MKKYSLLLAIIVTLLMVMTFTIGSFCLAKWYKQSDPSIFLIHLPGETSTIKSNSAGDNILEAYSFDQLDKHSQSKILQVEEVKRQLEQIKNNNETAPYGTPRDSETIYSNYFSYYQVRYSCGAFCSSWVEMGAYDFINNKYIELEDIASAEIVKQVKEEISEYNIDVVTSPEYVNKYISGLMCDMTKGDASYFETKEDCIESMLNTIINNNTNADYLQIYLIPEGVVIYNSIDMGKALEIMDRDSLWLLHWNEIKEY